MSDFDPEPLTWSVLLARWTEFAGSAVALPEDGEAGRVKASIADIITLQAVWFALGHLDELDGAERAVGLDRAGVLIERHAGAIRNRFGDEPMPGGLTDLLNDAEAAVVAKKHAYRKPPT